MRKARLWQIGFGITAVSALLLSNFSGFAQGGAQGFTGVWVTEKVITRKPKPDRVRPTTGVKNNAPPRREKVRLLTIQWRVLKQTAEGKAVEINPESTFYTGDRLRFAVKVNQNGYLYIIQDTEGDEAATIFPDAHINGGKNFVKKDVEYILPFNCDETHKDDCWFLMEPPDGREAVTVIFSRDKIITLPNDAEEAKKLIKKQTISSIKDSSPAPVRDKKPKSLGAGRFVTWVTNTNVKDNEELVSTFYLTHAAPKNDK
ncbi:MAG: DUF4384 domain-containing protein [Acidobacteria bacterium]|nr:DUF4384 domain-containing protein [Acidobacteriota bacterium]